MLKATLISILPARLQHYLRLVNQVHFRRGEPELRFIQQFLDSNKIAIDIGANFGVYSSVMCRNSKTVIALEPNPKCAAYLRQITPQSVEVVNVAISASEGSAALRIPVSGTLDMPGLATIDGDNALSDDDRITDVNAITVPTRTLDQVINEFNPSKLAVSLVKIDIEGHEFQALLGASETIAKQRPTFLIESEVRHGANLQQIFSLLGEYDYQAYSLINGAFVAVSADDIVAHQTGTKQPYINNIVFRPAEAPAPTPTRDAT